MKYSMENFQQCDNRVFMHQYPLILEFRNVIHVKFLSLHLLSSFVDYTYFPVLDFVPQKLSLLYVFSSLLFHLFTFNEHVAEMMMAYEKKKKRILGFKPAHTYTDAFTKFIIVGAIPSYLCNHVLDIQRQIDVNGLSLLHVEFSSLSFFVV